MYVPPPTPSLPPPPLPPSPLPPPPLPPPPPAGVLLSQPHDPAGGEARGREDKGCWLACFVLAT